MLCYLLDSNVSLSQKIHFYVMYNYGEQNTLFSNFQIEDTEKSQIFGKSAKWIFSTLLPLLLHIVAKNTHRDRGLHLIGKVEQMTSMCHARGETTFHLLSGHVTRVNDYIVFLDTLCT